MNSIRYLKMADFRTIERMTLYEYEIRMKAFRLQQIDREYEIHQQAWANWNVQATKKQGKNKRVPVFKTFKQFFDYEKYVKGTLEAPVEEGRKQTIADIIRRQKERRDENGKL